MKIIGKNTSLVIALALPVALVVVLAAFLYLPRLWVQPQHNFIYSTSYDLYRVENNRVVKKPDSNSSYYSYMNNVGGIYLYDVQTQTSRELSLAEAQGYSLSSDQTSPDGFIMEEDYGSGGLLGEIFGGGGYSNYHYLRKGNVTVKLNISTNNYVTFIGWVK
jgi:hypothetical protein